MFERFTDRARRVVVLAQHEARTLGHDYIGTEHILLGLIDEGRGVATTALTSMGINLDEMRQAVQDSIGRGAEPPPESGHIPFTPRAKKVLELSLREANQLGHNYIGTEHILLALIREGGGAAQLLAGAGVDLRPGPAAGPSSCCTDTAERARPPLPRPLRRLDELMGRLTSIATRLNRHRAAAQAVSPGMTPHSRRLSPRCQSVPTSAKPAALQGLDVGGEQRRLRLVVTGLHPAAGPFGDVRRPAPDPRPRRPTSRASSRGARRGSAACPRAGAAPGPGGPGPGIPWRPGRSGRRRAAGRRGAARRRARRTWRAARARAASAARWCSPRRPAPGSQAQPRRPAGNAQVQVGEAQPGHVGVRRLGVCTGPRCDRVQRRHLAQRHPAVLLDLVPEPGQDRRVPGSPGMSPAGAHWRYRAGAA